jgi:geranylgeranyl transferase type-1 subunit beta
MKWTISVLQKYGGFSKHPGELPDLLHTFYGICGLSLLGQDGLKALDVSLGVPIG